MMKRMIAALVLLMGCVGLAMGQDPVVDNDGGASNITVTSATLNGNLTSTGAAPTAVCIYWSSTYGGTNAWVTGGSGLTSGRDGKKVMS